MEQNSAASTPQPPEQPAAPPASTTPPPAPTRKPFPKKIVIIGGVVILVIAAVFSFILAGSSQQTANQEDAANDQSLQPTLVPEKTAADEKTGSASLATSHTLIYGAWTGQQSLIKAVSLPDAETQIVATLPMEIKRVSVIDNRTIVYIDQVDKREHGKQITIYDIKDKKAVATIPAAAGFGIDEYTLSPDKKYLATWEVAFAAGSEVLQGAKSRVYAVSLANPTTKNLLFDEVATKPVHYPRAILNNGTVFADTFMPNDPNGGAGWAYGMSMASFDGKTKKDIDTMKAGTYGTQPVLSQDGSSLLFAGYDGKYGNGLAIKRGIRQAILTPNTVELLNTQSLQRTKLENLPNTDSFVTAQWDELSGKIILSVVGEKAERTGLFAYDRLAKKLEKITIPPVNSTAYTLVAGLSQKQHLVGAFEEKAANVGNLGAGYEYAYNKLAVFDATTAKSTPLTLQDTYAQYITVLPANYFSGVLGTKTIAQANVTQTIIDQYSDKNDPKEKVQLYTFFLKNEIQQVRTKQQSTPLTMNISSAPVNPGGSSEEFRTGDDGMPLCNDVTAKTCAEKGQGPGSSDYLLCKGEYKAQNMNRTCDDSPLYLYGTSGQKVEVTINTPVYNAIPAYNDGYSVTLQEGGKMQIGKGIYERIAYDYSSNLRIRKAPTTGTIATLSNVASVLTSYAQKLGLNEKETADLVKAGRQKITSPYVFISFYDHETSHRILPISFAPAPDAYLNVVFYFKLLDQKPNLTPVPPVFPDPLERIGFTAVEVSEIIEN